MSSAVNVLKSWGIPIGEKFPVTLPEGQCSSDGLRHINEYIGRWCYEQRKKGLVIDLPNPANLAKNDSVWKLLRDSNGRTWVKRYADYVKDISGIRLGSKFLGQLGNSVTHGFTGINVTEYVVDFTDICDWSPPEFGEYENSCWWTDYNELRMSFFDGWGGCALRLYDDAGRNGIGRAMIHGDSGSLFFFNFYERNENANLDRLRGILEKVFSAVGINEVEIRDCDFSSNIYINNNAIECRSEKSQRGSFYECYEMEVDRLFRYCTICEDNYHINEMTQISNDQYICNHCQKREDLLECDCGRIGAEHQMRWSEVYKKFFCNGCYHTELRQCNMCGERYKRDELSVIGFRGEKRDYLGVVNVCPNCMLKLGDNNNHEDDEIKRMISREVGVSRLPSIVSLIVLDRTMTREQRSRDWSGPLITWVKF